MKSLKAISIDARESKAQICKDIWPLYVPTIEVHYMTLIFDIINLFIDMWSYSLLFLSWVPKKMLPLYQFAVQSIIRASDKLVFIIRVRLDDAELAQGGPMLRLLDPHNFVLFEGELGARLPVRGIRGSH